jgi:T5SS/PEP-CTERM-associated repeat protein
MKKYNSIGCMLVLAGLVLFQQSVVAAEISVDASFSQTISSVTNVTSFNVGYYSADNSLFIENGGVVTNGYNSFVGREADSDNNGVTVSGTAASWVNELSMNVGYHGSANSLTITNGGSVECEKGYVGFYSDSTNNRVLVTGDGSSWNCSEKLYVGMAGSENTLTISDGGLVTSDDGYISASSSNNSVVVNGMGSLWSNADQLSVGYDGHANSLTVTNGGCVTSSDIRIGYQSDSDNNNMLVSGEGSSATNSSILSVGYYGNENRLDIRDGGSVISSSVRIGHISSSESNRVIVSGVDSKLEVLSLVAVGYSGSENSLIIEDGGRVENSYGYVGKDSSSSNNSAVVTGTGSVWENAEGLRIGSIDGNSGNSVTVSDGGTLIAESVIVYENNELNIEENGRLETGDIDMKDATLMLNGAYAVQGTATLSGNLMMGSAGELELTLDGLTDFDTLNVTGDWTIDGTLTVLLAEGVSVTDGSSFDLFDWEGSVSGEFSELELAELSDGLSWDTSNLYTDGMIGVIPEPAVLSLVGVAGVALLITRRFCS